MSILIKGMEMPESCYYCPFADGVWQKDKRCLVNGKEMPRNGRDVQQNHINCPLVELPPHGDLVDKRMLLNDIANNAFANAKEEYEFWNRVWEYIRKTPVVVESEE